MVYKFSLVKNELISVWDGHNYILGKYLISLYYHSEVWGQ